MNPRLSTAICNFCGEKVSGDDPFQTYHIYLNHREKLRQCFDENFYEIPLFLRKIFTKEEMYQIMLKKMEEIDQSENDKK